jgi:hypothetical protein
MQKVTWTGPRRCDERVAGRTLLETTTFMQSNIIPARTRRRNDEPGLALAAPLAGWIGSDAPIRSGTAEAWR